MRSEPCLQEHLFQNFNSERHSGILYETSVTLIDKADKNPTKREHYSRHTLKTLATLDLIVEDDF